VCSYTIVCDNTSQSAHSNATRTVFNQSALTETSTTPPHWYLLGAGAIGTLMGANLQAAGHRVSAFLRNEQNAQDSLPVTLVRQADKSNPAKLDSLAFPVALRSGPDNIHHLLVTTKSYDVYSAVHSVAHRLSKHCHVVLLTNGMGLAQQLEEAFPSLDITCGTTTEGAFRESPGRVVHAGRGQTRLGRHTGLHVQEHTEHDSQQQQNHRRSRPAVTAPPPWFEHWQSAVDDSQWDNNVNAALWDKLAVNCVINPLTALYRCRNGELATNAKAEKVVAILCREVQQVSYALGFTTTAQRLQHTVAEVIQGTAANQSSMLQDVMAGRQTEIEDITGFLLREAQRYGIPVPENQRMLESILALC